MSDRDVSRDPCCPSCGHDPDDFETWWDDEYPPAACAGCGMKVADMRGMPPWSDTEDPDAK